MKQANNAKQSIVTANSREAITYYLPQEDREPDQAPLSWQQIRRIFSYTQPHARKRNWLFV